MNENSCLRCGRCCEQFPMTDEQILKITEYLLSHEEVMHLLRSTPEILGIGMKVCPFLRGKAGNTFCSIYPVRPEICKVFATPGIKGAECPNNTICEEYTIHEAEEMLEVYSVPVDQVKYPVEYFRNLIKGE